MQNTAAQQCQTLTLDKKKASSLRRGFLYYLLIETLLKMRSIICRAVTPSASAS